MFTGCGMSHPTLPGLGVAATVVSASVHVVTPDAVALESAWAVRTKRAIP